MCIRHADILFFTLPTPALSGSGKGLKTITVLISAELTPAPLLLYKYTSFFVKSQETCLSKFYICLQ